MLGGVVCFQGLGPNFGFKSGCQASPGLRSRLVAFKTVNSWVLGDSPFVSQAKGGELAPISVGTFSFPEYHTKIDT